MIERSFLSRVGVDIIWTLTDQLEGLWRHFGPQYISKRLWKLPLTDLASAMRSPVQEVGCWGLSGIHITRISFLSFVWLSAERPWREYHQGRKNLAM